jgi:hypothetical protein
VTAMRADLIFGRAFAEVPERAADGDRARSDGDALREAA